MATALTKVLLQVCRAVSVTTMEISASLATSVSGGVRPRAIQIMPGTSTWIINLAM